MERIKIGEYELSIQASKFHYCTPRETITDLYKYKEMEVAIFNKDAWVDLEEDIFLITGNIEINFYSYMMEWLQGMYL